MSGTKKEPSYVDRLIELKADLEKDGLPAEDAAKAYGLIYELQRLLWPYSN